MLTRRRLLSYSALAPAALDPLLWGRSSSPGHTADQAAPPISSRPLDVHRRAFVFDAHVRALDREFYNGDSMGERKTDGQWDLSRARERGESAFFLSVFIPEEYYPSRPGRRCDVSITRSGS